MNDPYTIFLTQVLMTVVTFGVAVAFLWMFGYMIYASIRRVHLDRIRALDAKRKADARNP